MNLQESYITVKYASEKILIFRTEGDQTLISEMLNSMVVINVKIGNGNSECR